REGTGGSGTRAGATSRAGSCGPRSARVRARARRARRARGTRSDSSTASADAARAQHAREGLVERRRRVDVDELRARRKACAPKRRNVLAEPREIRSAQQPGIGREPLVTLEI